METIKEAQRKILLTNWSIYWIRSLVSKKLEWQSLSHLKFFALLSDLIG